MAQGIGNQITKSFTSRSLVQICPLFSSDQKLFPADGFSVSFVPCFSDPYPMLGEKSLLALALGLSAHILLNRNQ